MTHEPLDSKKAEAMLAQGKTLQNFFIKALDISYNQFENDVTIINCVIEHFNASHCAFKGKADFFQTQFGRAIEMENQPQDASAANNSVEPECSFNNAFFSEDANFEECVFSGPTDFLHATFEKNARFKKAQFNDEATFMDAAFEWFPSFEYAKFNKETNFSSVAFGEEVIFRNSEFSGLSDFTSAKFGSAEFQDCKFNDSTIFQQARFESWADFSRAIFDGEFDLAHATFSNGADFSEVWFNHIARFERTIFSEDCYFVEAIFGKLADFDTITFLKGADFRKCIFKDRAEFRNATITEGTFVQIECDRPILFSGARASKINFQNALMKNAFIFSNTTVQESANFGATVFEKTAMFDGATLTQALFNQTKFNGRCSFKETLFHNESKFEKAEFNGDTDFYKSIFNGKVNFDETKFRHVVFFRNVQFKQEEVCFKSVTFQERADFTGAVIEKSICLQDLIAENVIINWSQIDGKLVTHQLDKFEDARKVYGLLKNLFEKQNKYEDMDKAYRMFKRMERKTQDQDTKNPFKLFKKFLNFLILDKGSGYGTRPLNIAVMTILIILLFGGFYYFASSQIIVGGSPLSLSNPLDRLGFCIYFSSVSFVTLGAENLYPNYYSWLKYVVTFQAFTGFFMMTLFVVTVTRKVIR